MATSRMLRSAAMSCLLVGMWPPAAALAQATGSLSGRVVNDRTDLPLAGVDVSIPYIKQQVMTDSTGAFVMPSVAAGRYLVVLRKLGYQPFSTMVTINAGDGPEYLLELIPATPELAKVEVKASVLDRRLTAFDEHRKSNMGGNFLTAKDFEQEKGRALADVLQSVAGSDIVRGSAGAAWFATRRGYDSYLNMPKATKADQRRGASSGVCYAAVVLNNVFVYRGNDDEQLFDLSSLSPSEILAIEVYRGGATMPLEYNATRKTCGLLVIWTK